MRIGFASAAADWLSLVLNKQQETASCWGMIDFRFLPES